MRWTHENTGAHSFVCAAMHRRGASRSGRVEHGDQQPYMTRHAARSRLALGSQYTAHAIERDACF
jgi:hypothetical protein